MSIGFRSAGRSGLVVSELGLGTAAFGHRNRIPSGQRGVDAIVGTALDHGVTLFDTAESYGDEPGVSESMLGLALTGHRDDVIISTKFSRRHGAPGPPDWGAHGSRRHVRLAVEGSLRRLRTDWIDLYQLHQPDPLTPIEETLEVLDELVREGKVRYTGSSNFAGWQIADAEHTARAHGYQRFAATTNEYSLLWRKAEEELIPAVTAFGIGFLAYFPLQNGLLTGKYTRDESPAEGKVTRFKPHLLARAPWAALDRLREFAAKRDLSLVQVAYGWLLAQPGVTTLVTGATSPAQVTANAAVTGWRPTAAEDAELRALFAGDLSGAPGVSVSSGQPLMRTSS
ncbi:MAG: aldo/keto reductase [Actinobacteria bacterium]|nr:aldo/keto reductase [Actinomycetota bacterium]